MTPVAPDTKATGAAAESARLTKIQKLAALLLILGPDAAAQLFKHLDPPDVESICMEMTKFSMIDQGLQHELLKEFSDVAVQASTAVRGGLDVARSSLEKALGVFKASEIIARMAPSRTSVAAMHDIADMEVRQIYNLIRHEQPQTVALVLSYVGADKAAEALNYFHAEVRDRILERIATLAPTPIEAVEKVVEVLIAKRGTSQTRALSQTGGIKTAADMLNAMEKTSSGTLLGAIEGRNPDLGLAIRQTMFTFEDLIRLDATMIQLILREVDLRDLAVALKTSSDSLRTLLLSCITKRAAESVQEEMTFMGPVRLRDIEAAQMRIIDVLRRLEAEGAIDLGEPRRPLHHELA